MGIREFKQINERRWLKIANVEAIGLSCFNNNKLSINIAVNDETQEILDLIKTIPYPVRIVIHKKDNT